MPGPKYSGGTRSNVVCNMAAILSRPQCVLIRMTLYYMLPLGHTMCSLVAVILQRYQSLKSEIQKEQNNWSLHALVLCFAHYDGVIMSRIASQITSLTIVYWIVYSDADQRKHQSSASLAFVRGIHRGQVNSSHKWPVTRKMFPFDDVIMNDAFNSRH